MHITKFICFAILGLVSQIYAGSIPSADLSASQNIADPSGIAFPAEDTRITDGLSDHGVGNRENKSTAQQRVELGVGYGRVSSMVIQ